LTVNDSAAESRMQYKVTHTTAYSYAEAVPVCHNEVHLTPRDGRHQRCSLHRLRIRPEPLEPSKRLDYFGNICHQFSILESHRRLSITAVSRVAVNPPALPELADTPAWETIREQVQVDFSPQWLDALQTVFASPSIRITPAVREYAEPSFPAGRPILAAVHDLTSRIHRDFQYDNEATTIETHIAETLQLRRGVCQDFAHLQIGCLRAMGLPARYVSGYLRTIPQPGRPRLVGADASHAWLSVFCGSAGWIDADPTNDCFPTTDHITVAWGRDYSDVCPIKGVYVGGGEHRMTVSVDVLPIVDDDSASATTGRSSRTDPRNGGDEF
jgi:transglutaminase-like putative cysteine protease